MVFIEKYTLASSTSYATPYYVIRGDRSGPTIMVVSGIHGNETGSIRAAQSLVNQFMQQKLYIQRGTLVIVPLVNQKAYRKRARGVPDLNRTFAGNSSATTRHPLSAALFQLMKYYRPSWYLDLHEANGLSQKNSRRLGQTLIIHSGSRGIVTVRRVIKGINRTISTTAHHFNIRLRERPGSSRAAAARIVGVKAVTVETCWSLEYAVRVHYQTDIVKRFLRKGGLM